MRRFMDLVAKVKSFGKVNRANFSCKKENKRKKLTLGINPFRIQVGQRRLVVELIDGLLRLMVDLEDAARPPPAASLVVGNHRIRTVSTTSAGNVGARVVRDDPRDKDRGRQLDGVAAGSRLTQRREQVSDLERVEILGGFFFLVCLSVPCPVSRCVFMPVYVLPLIVAAEKLVTKAEYDLLRCSRSSQKSQNPGEAGDKKEKQKSSVCVWRCQIDVEY